MSKMKTMSLDEITNMYWGSLGSPKRDQMEACLAEETYSWELTKALRQAREAQNIQVESLIKPGIPADELPQLEQTISKYLTSLGLTLEPVHPQDK